MAARVEGGFAVPIPDRFVCDSRLRRLRFMVHGVVPEVLSYCACHGVSRRISRHWFCAACVQGYGYEKWGALNVGFRAASLFVF